jgi:hypothetical protein
LAGPVKANQDVVAGVGSRHDLIFLKIEAIFGTARMIPPRVVPSDLCGIGGILAPHGEDRLWFKAKDI